MIFLLFALLYLLCRIARLACRERKKSGENSSMSIRPCDDRREKGYQKFEKEREKIVGFSFVELTGFICINERK